MADIVQLQGISQGISDSNQNLQGIQTGVNDLKGPIDGIHSVLSKELKTSIISVPEFMRQVYEQLSASGIPGIIGIQKLLEEYFTSEKSKSDSEIKEDPTLNQPGQKEWTADDLAAKMPSKIAAPALMLGTTLNQLLGENSTFISSLTQLKDAILPILENMKTVKSPGAAAGGDKKGAEEAAGGEGNKFAAPNPAQLLAFKLALFELGFIMDALKKAFIDPKTGEPRISEKEIKVIQESILAINLIATVFINLQKALFSALLIGALVIPAIIMTLLAAVWVLITWVIIKILTSKVFENTSKAAAAAINIATVFSQLREAILNSLIAGVLAIPAVIASIFIMVWLLFTMVIVGILNLISPLLETAVNASRILEKIASNFLNTLILLTVSVLFIPFALIGIIGMLAIMIIMTVIAAIGMVLLPMLIVLDKSVVGTMFSATLMYFLTMVLLALSVPFIIPAIIGMIGMLLIMVAFTGIGILATIALPFIGAILVVAILMAITAVALLITLTVLKKLLDFVKEMSNNAPPAPNMSNPMFAFAMQVLFTLLPIGLIIIAFAILGIIAIIAILPMIGLMLFSIFAFIGILMLGLVVKALFDLIKIITDQTSGENPAVNAISQAFPALGPFSSLIAILLMVVGLIFVVLGVAILGIVATLAMPFMIGLLIFSVLAIPALNNLANVITALSAVVLAVRGFGKGEDENNTGGILSKIPGLGEFASIISMLGTIIGLIFIIGALGILGLVATAAALPMAGLRRFSQLASEALPELASAIQALGPLLQNVNTVNAIAQSGGDSGGLFGSIAGFFGGSNAKLAVQIGMLGGIIEALGEIGGIAGKEGKNFSDLANVSGSLKAALIGLNDGFRYLGPLMYSSQGITEKQMKDIGKIVQTIVPITKDLITISMNSTQYKGFRTNIEENIIQPLLQLDSPIQKLARIKDEVKNLNSELSKLAKDNKDTLKAISNINNSSATGLSTFIAKLPSIFKSATNNNNNSEVKDYSNDPLSSIAKDVKGIAQHLIKKDSVSWTDEPIRGKI